MVGINSERSCCICFLYQHNSDWFSWLYLCWTSLFCAFDRNAARCTTPSPSTAFPPRPALHFPLRRPRSSLQGGSGYHWPTKQERGSIYCPIDRTLEILDGGHTQTHKHTQTHTHEKAQLCFSANVFLKRVKVYWRSSAAKLTVSEINNDNKSVGLYVECISWEHLIGFTLDVCVVKGQRKCVFCGLSRAFTENSSLCSSFRVL